MEEKLNRLNNVLQWSIQQSSEGVNEGLGRTEEELEEMKRRLQDKSNREFLEQVLKGDVEHMKEATAILKNEESKDTDILNALCNLQNFVEQIDNANDLDKIGGLQPVIKCTQNKENKDIRKHAFVVMGMVAQNNPEGKKKIMEKGGLVYIIKTLRDEKEDEVLERAIFALSTLAKHEPNIQLAITKMKGLSSLVDILKLNEVSDPTKMKTIFFLSKLLIENPKKWTPYFLEINLIDILCGQIKSFNEKTSFDLIEKSIEFLNIFLKSDEKYVKEYNVVELYDGLKELLLKRKETEKDDTEYIEQLISLLKL